ncbi:hypothetical protein E2C01_045413 [Portunus trituberculatus]|uniref:Uncharacterized protein n=1 Tax=Portunus trituberculatus TaxID=210409 RepID=A0A5B7G501_PORTR|nr:hypothetical protein [Portunus trituberculatus]
MALVGCYGQGRQRCSLPMLSPSLDTGGLPGNSVISCWKWHSHCDQTPGVLCDSERPCEREERPAPFGVSYVASRGDASSRRGVRGTLTLRFSRLCTQYSSGSSSALYDRVRVRLHLAPELLIVYTRGPRALMEESLTALFYLADEYSFALI